MKKQFLSARWQMAFVGVGLWLLLALWSLSAFWSHIDSLGESYQLAAKCGAMAGEFALLALILWHCFNAHIGVRRWALILGFLLAVVVLVHSGAVRGHTEAKTERLGTEQRLAQQLTAMSREQAAAIGEGGGRLASSGATQKERMAISSKAAAEQRQIATNAQQILAAEITKSDQIVKQHSILPEWYLNGWCYSVIFLCSLLCVGVIFLLMMNEEDIDRDFDNIPDNEQGGLVAQTHTTTTVSPLPAPAVAAPRLTAEDAAQLNRNQSAEDRPPATGVTAVWTRPNGDSRGN